MISKREVDLAAIVSASPAFPRPWGMHRYGTPRDPWIETRLDLCQWENSMEHGGNDSYPWYIYTHIHTSQKHTRGHQDFDDSVYGLASLVLTYSSSKWLGNLHRWLGCHTDSIGMPPLPGPVFSSFSLMAHMTTSRSFMMGLRESSPWWTNISGS